MGELRLGKIAVYGTGMNEQTNPDPVPGALNVLNPYPTPFVTPHVASAGWQAGGRKFLITNKINTPRLTLHIVPSLAGATYNILVHKWNSLALVWILAGVNDTPYQGAVEEVVEHPGDDPIYYQIENISNPENTVSIYYNPYVAEAL